MKEQEKKMKNVKRVKRFRDKKRAQTTEDIEPDEEPRPKRVKTESSTADHEFGKHFCENTYERADSALAAINYNLMKFDEPEMKVIRIATAHDGIGDICASEITINDKRALVVTFYITSDSTLRQIKQFFILNLMAYSHKISGLFEEIDELALHTIPIILTGDMNLNLDTKDGEQLISFLNENLRLELNNDPKLPTTRGKTCIDAVLTRYIENIEIRHYISYFSYHKPLLTITDESSDF